MYDAADSAFTTVIITALYAPFFSKVIVGDSIRGTHIWGYAFGISEVVVGILAPILGAIADFSGSRKKFLGRVRAGHRFLHRRAVVRAAGHDRPGHCAVRHRQRGVRWRRHLHRQLPARDFERVERRAAFPASSGPSATERPRRGDARPDSFSGAIDTPTPELIDRARLIPVVVAAYYAVMVIPTFVFLRDRSVPQPLPPGENYVSVGFKQLQRTFAHIRRYRELVKLLVAFLVYNDGIVTVIGFAAIYAVDTIGFASSEIVIMFVTLNVVAAASAFIFGRVADRIGQKRTILITLAIWIVAVTIAYLAHDKTTFWVGATLVGIGMGSSQSVTRSLLALFTPQQNASEFFGFLGIAGKALAFLGPILFGEITSRTGSQRPAIFAIAAFFVVGMILVSFVDEQKGKEAAKTAIV